MNKLTQRGAIMFETRFAIGLTIILLLSACGTTQTAKPQATPDKPHVMPEVLAAMPLNEAAMAAVEPLPMDSKVIPSRYSMLFNTLEVPLPKVKASTQPPEALLKNLQQAVIQKIRAEHLFSRVITKSEDPLDGAVLTLNATILSWEAHADKSTIEIKLQIEHMVGKCEFTNATTKGSLNHVDNGEKGHTIIYEIDPLVDGTTAFIKDFMVPNPVSLDGTTPHSKS